MLGADMIDHDLALVLGGVICALSVPAIVAAFSESRAPRIGALMILTGGALIVWALTGKPEGYRLDQIPDVFATIVRRMLG